MWLWRAVDSEGEVLNLLVQPKRDAKAVLRLTRNDELFCAFAQFL